MKVASFLKDNGACGYYRITLPMTELSKAEHVGVVQLQLGDNLETIVQSMYADAMIWPRACDQSDLDMMDAVKGHGHKFITDYDDNLFAVSPLSPHYKDFGTEEVRFKADDGSILDVWIDGKNLDIKENKKRQDNVKRCVESVDAVFVTTELLADVYRQYTDKVYVLPNSIDLSLWESVKIKRKNPDEVRLYWSGGSSHYEDVILLQEALTEIVKKYPEVTVVMMGMDFKGVRKNIPEDRFEFHNWVSTPAYPYKTILMDADISLIPLRDTEFSRCKSNIKWVEQGALLVPSVTSLVSPYKEWYNGTNGVFVENNSTQGWVDGISYLIENPIERWSMGAEARKTVEQHFDIKSNVTKWYLALEEIIYAD
jgi:glycosyltransferase involved in cell wall biosynthesis